MLPKIPARKDVAHGSPVQASARRRALPVGTVLSPSMQARRDRQNAPKPAPKIKNRTYTPVAEGAPRPTAYMGRHIIDGADVNGKQYYYDGTKVHKDFIDANGNNIDDREDKFAASGVGLRDRNGNRIDDRGEGLMQGYRGMEYKDGLTVEEYGQKHNLDPRYSKYWHKGGGQIGNRTLPPLQHHQTYEQKLAQVQARQQQAPQQQYTPAVQPMTQPPTSFQAPQAPMQMPTLQGYNGDIMSLIEELRAKGLI